MVLYLIATKREAARGLIEALPWLTLHPSGAPPEVVQACEMFGARARAGELADFTGIAKSLQESA